MSILVFDNKKYRDQPENFGPGPGAGKIKILVPVPVPVKIKILVPGLGPLCGSLIQPSRKKIFSEILNCGHITYSTRVSIVRFPFFIFFPEHCLLKYLYQLVQTILTILLLLNCCLHLINIFYSIVRLKLTIMYEIRLLLESLSK